MNTALTRETKDKIFSATVIAIKAIVVYWLMTILLKTMM